MSTHWLFLASHTKAALLCFSYRLGSIAPFGGGKQQKVSKLPFWKQQPCKYLPWIQFSFISRPHEMAAKYVQITNNLIVLSVFSQCFLLQSTNFMEWGCVERKQSISKGSVNHDPYCWVCHDLFSEPSTLFLSEYCIMISSTATI